ncbi:hypothetical protein EVAR_103906_1 [Eumeta japonica]|uniref:Uncharacterized protein n=1 Tax=Eumeta variegata TaxID=151549 RepID=A0A4C1T8U1_EUMVA|nr:hypothetical protein EVAR_103906_1 [Eumeta japonica]
MFDFAHNTRRKRIDSRFVGVFVEQMSMSNREQVVIVVHEHRAILKKSPVCFQLWIGMGNLLEFAAREGNGLDGGRMG